MCDRFQLVGWVQIHINPNKKPPTRGGFLFGGEGGIRTLEPLLGGYTISNRARSTNYATSP